MLVGSASSQMHLKYLHYFGNESNESILEAYGIIASSQQIDQLRPKQCPNCSEPNKPDSRFCNKCRMVLTYDAYSETLESQKEKEDKITVMEKQFSTMERMLEKLVMGLSKSTDPQQFNNMAQTLFSSGIFLTSDDDSKLVDSS